MSKYLIITAFLFLGACAFPGTYAGLDKEQLAEIAKMEDASVVCVQGKGPPMSGQGMLIIAHVSRHVRANLVVMADCSVGINNEWKPTNP